MVLTIINDLILANHPIKNTKFLLSYGIFSYTVFVGLSLIDEIRNAHIKIKEISQKVFIDPLTGVYNRYILTNIELNENDVIVFFDLNDLKKINNKHGHKTGDEALIFLANTLKGFLRKDDYIIRLGGDEFVVIMRNCNISKSKEKFEIIQKHLKEFRISLSISYGIVQYKDSIEKSLKRADKYMYRMKSSMKKSKSYKYK
ncbi:GGDEF domain-containing protein [Marinitoga lauensis]|uniref:GGDEF domain-containing protein n=1 Tax=Marinitoga lauensis TaxID=2201189 RepID=UPI001404285A|nr:GGDEF domain-containing protein [Marinitoga lauensis]